MPEVILRNFALNDTLSKHKVDCDPFLKEIEALFKSDPYNEINRMRLCFIFHASSVRFSCLAARHSPRQAPLPAHQWFHIIWCGLNAEIKNSGFLQHIFDKAAKFLRNSQVREAQVAIINSLLDDPEKQVTLETLPPPPEIVVVALREEIRGWPGIKRFYINVRAFLNGLVLIALSLDFAHHAGLSHRGRARRRLQRLRQSLDGDVAARGGA